MNIEWVEQIKAGIRSGYYEGFIFPSGLVYFGGLYRKRAHGKGVIILPSGKYYRYEFDNGRLVNGKGIVVYPDGSFYEGEVSESGKPFGQAIVHNPDDSTFFSGVWNHNYDPKIIWICAPPMEYFGGKVFQEEPRNQNLYTCNYILYPAILLRNPEDRDSKYRTKPANVMFPHLQEAGLPNYKNSALIYSWGNTPREAINIAGYDVEAYVKIMICPDAVVAGRLLPLVKLSQLYLKFPGHESFGYQMLGFMLNFSENYLDTVKKDGEKPVIRDWVKIINNY